MADHPRAPRLPLFPLPDVVHFPRTALRLHVFEPRYRRMVRDLVSQEEDRRWIGMVLLKPGPERGFGEPPEIFREGTAGRLVEVDPLPDGRSNILLVGEFRFAVEREVTDLERPYRQAVVRPLAEVAIDERDPGVVAVRREIVGTARELASEMGEQFPLDAGQLDDLEARASFETLANRLASDLDVPALRKLSLLAETLPERALEVLKILQSRQRVLDLLRPFRHLADGREGN